MMSDRLKERLYLSVPHMSEASLRYVQEAFATNWLTTMGPNLVALEEAAGRCWIELTSLTLSDAARSSLS
jgi:dTDP-4-amino-4,6-dideoxygalactose transaminase